jgi:hypothetical protein
MCTRAPGLYQEGFGCAPGASSLGVSSPGPMCVRVRGMLEGVAKLVPQEVSLGSWMGVVWALPMMCFCDFRSPSPAGYAFAPGHLGRLCRSASFTVT